MYRSGKWINLAKSRHENHARGIVSFSRFRIIAPSSTPSPLSSARAYFLSRIRAHTEPCVRGCASMRVYARVMRSSLVGSASYMKYRLAGDVAVGDVTRRTIYDQHAMYRIILLIQRNGPGRRSRARRQMARAFEYRRFRRFMRAAPRASDRRARRGSLPDRACA